MDLLQSDYDYNRNKGGVSQILQQYGQLDIFKAGGFSAISPKPNLYKPITHVQTGMIFFSGTHSIRNTI